MIKIPKAPKHPSKFKNHGDTRIDNYFWLKDKNHPETMPYIKGENAYFEASLKPLLKLKNKLYKEMKSRIQEEDSSYPAPDGDYLYYTKFKKGKQYRIDCRKLKNGGKEEVILDANQLAKGKKYFHSAGSSLSFDQKILAHGVDYDGSERYKIFLKNLDTKKSYSDVLKNTNGAMVWSADNLHIFYTVLDKNLRPHRVYRHKLGEKTTKDKLVFEEKDPKNFIHIYTSASKEYIFINSGNNTSSICWYLRADQAYEDFRVFTPREEGVIYDVDHRGEDFWIHTNYKAKNFQIMKAPVSSPQRKNWKTFYANSKLVSRSGMTLFADLLVISERQNGLPQIRVYDFRVKKDHVLSFDEAVYNVGLDSGNYEYHTEVIRIGYSSPKRPYSLLEYNPSTKKFITLKVKQVKGHNPNRYVSERVWVKGHDGVKIPLSLLYKKGLKKNAKNPCLMYGYGSYGMTMPDGFPGSTDYYRLIDRGFIFAVAHIRGGSEMGREWYENAKFLKKKNTFKDFISCAEFLTRNKWTASSKLAIAGGSAGGMLMGACMNMRPELFNVVVAHVPFVDVINTMLDRDLPLTQLEYKEWGNPEDKKYYRYMKSYSPYDNVEAKAYPHMFVTCGLNDPRVTYWEPAKWVAKLRDLKTDDNQIVFKTNMGAGHFGNSGRFTHLDETAEEFAYVLDKMGIHK